MQGFITIHRQLIESSVYKDSHAVHLWLHLLMKANHKDKEFIQNGKMVMVKRGQTLTGRKVLSAETGIQESKIQRLLKLFENMQMIEQHTNNRNRLITVLSYDKFQAGEQQVNNTRTTGEQLVNTNNNVNNNNNVNKKYSTDDLAAAEWIYQKLLVINPDHKKPNMDKWADTIRLMRESDKRTHKDICRVFAWANSDPFWSTNVLSPASLRKNYDKLSIKANQPVISKNTLFSDGNGVTDDDYIDHAPAGYIEHG